MIPDPSFSSGIPSDRQLSDLHDLLITTYELFQIYDVLQQHTRLPQPGKSQELFLACRDQLQEEVAQLNEQLHRFHETLKQQLDIVELEENDPLPAWTTLPDVETPESGKNVHDLVKKAFSREDLLEKQMLVCQRGAQLRRDQKLEMQMKMSIVSASQRCQLLENRHGFARGKISGETLLDNLKRQTTRIFSALSGEKKDD